MSLVLPTSNALMPSRIPTFTQHTSAVGVQWNCSLHQGSFDDAAALRQAPNWEAGCEDTDSHSRDDDVIISKHLNFVSRRSVGDEHTAGTDETDDQACKVGFDNHRVYSKPYHDSGWILGSLAQTLELRTVF